jgi:amino acid transporter
LHSLKNKLTPTPGGAEVFGWFSNLTSLITLFGWGMICLSNIRMRHAWKVQGRSMDDLPWKSWTWPWGAYWGLSWCIILIIAEFYLAVWPLGEKPSAEHFFSVYCSVIAVLLLYIGAKIYYRNGKWVDVKTIDLDAGRRFYKSQEVEDAEVKGKGGWAKKVAKGVFS